MQKIKTVAETHDYDECMIDKNVEKSLYLDVQPFFIQESGGEVDQEI